MLYVGEGTRENLLAIENAPLEGFYIQLNSGNTKWKTYFYNPGKNKKEKLLAGPSQYLNIYSSKKKKKLGNFNVSVNENQMQCFCDTNDLKKLIKQPTCYKIPGNHTYLDLMLAYVPRSFCNAHVLEMGVSYFHLMTLTVMRKG